MNELIPAIVTYSKWHNDYGILIQGTPPTSVIRAAHNMDLTPPQMLRGVQKVTQPIISDATKLRSAAQESSYVDSWKLG